MNHKYVMVTRQSPGVDLYVRYSSLKNERFSVIGWTNELSEAKLFTYNQIKQTPGLISRGINCVRYDILLFDKVLGS